MDTNTEAGSPARAGRREWLGLAVLALPTILLSIDISVLYLALPYLAADLKPSSVQQLWILDIYAFLIAGFLITMGTVGDRIGRRRLLMIGAAAFGVATTVAAYSSSPEMLIASRALMGIAGATLMPSTLALISTMFKDPAQMGVAIGVWMSCFMSGAAIGPLVGGTMLDHFWWGSVFLIGVPVMVLLLIAAPFLLPEYKDPEAGRPDAISVALSLAAILPVIYGLKEFAKDGLEVVPVVTVVAGLVFGVLFVQRQRTLADPILDLRLFSDRSFSVSLGSMLFGIIAVSGLMFFITQYLQLVEGLSPLRAGLWLLPTVVAMTAGSMLTPYAARRIRPAHLIGAGFAVSVLGLALLSQVESGIGVLVTSHVLIGVGMSPMLALGTNLVMGSAPEEKAGSAASLSETSGEVGGALGVAILGSIGTAVYRDQIAENLPPGLSPDAAGQARDTLAGAVTTADQLPAVSSQLLDAAREAFVQGMNTAAGISAVFLAGVAVLVVVMLRHVPPTGVPEAEAAPAPAEVPDSEVPSTDTIR